MICVNSFDQKVGELHVWGSNRRFDVITLTEELRKLDGRVIVSTKIISGSFTDCATIAKIPTMDRQLKVILTTSINISITINYYYLFTWHRQFGNVEGLDNTQSFADVFGDCQKSSASKPHYWPEIKTHVCGFTFCWFMDKEIKQIQNSTQNSVSFRILQFPIRWKKLNLTNGSEL